MTGNTSDISLHFLDYWRVIRNRAPIIITIFLLTFMTGYVVTVYYLEKLYSSSTQIRVTKKEKDIKVFGGSEDAGFDPVFFQAEVEVIQSKKILYPVIEKLHLDKIWATRLFKLPQPLRIDQAYGFLLGRGLDVSFKRGANLIDIRGVSDLPQEAADIANTVAEVYSQERRSDETNKASRGFETLDIEIVKQKDSLQKAKENIEKLRKDLNIDVVGGTNEQMIEVEWQRKKGMLDEAQSDFIARQVRFDELKKLPFNQLVDALAAMGMEDTNLSALRGRQLLAESDLEQMLKSGLEVNHPRIQARKAEVDKIKDQIVNIVEGKRKALDIDVQVTKARVAQLEKEVKALEDKVRLQQTTVMAPYKDALREADRQQNILDALMIRRKQEYIDSTVNNDPVTVVSKAEPSDHPFRPNNMLNFVASAAVGLILGLVLAFFIEYLDTSVKTMDDVEKFLGLPVLTIIPDGVRSLIQEGPDSPNAEGYRILRAKLNIEHNKTGTGRAITMLSGGPGEGKSTTLFNLAYVCAQAGQSVLLIDADLRRPTVHTILDIENESGLADVFLGKGEPKQYLRSTQIPNLHVMTSGHMPPAEIGIFSGQKLREVLDDLKKRYDLIFIDSPPVLGISDGSVISHEADFTMLVIQHRRFPRDISLRAKKAIEEVKGNLIGVVLNAVELKSDEAYYYYSSYGDYYHKSDKAKKERVKKLSDKPKETKVAESKNQEGGGSDSF
jgi:polysaccharide biosynthesis transport protein